MTSEVDVVIGALRAAHSGDAKTFRDKVRSGATYSRRAQPNAPVVIGPLTMKILAGSTPQFEKMCRAQKENNATIALNCIYPASGQFLFLIEDRKIRDVMQIVSE